VAVCDAGCQANLSGGDRDVPTSKTNAIRLLDRQGIAYELRAYEVDPDDLAAESVARKVGLPAEQVFKTLVARGDKTGICLAVVPGDAQLDLKALARCTGDKKVETVPLKEVEPLTGYIRGGVTALACKKDYPVFLDETAQLFDVISISAGQRGLQVLLAPDDYVRVVQAQVAAIGKEKE
jgi:Cys-tRNA(Pro)/Cys-tRNA(Cys) deacylase